MLCFNVISNNLWITSFKLFTKLWVKFELADRQFQKICYSFFYVISLKLDKSIYLTIVIETKLNRVIYSQGSLEISSLLFQKGTITVFHELLVYIKVASQYKTVQ